METAREVVYNRVDPSGTKEVTVIRQGATRILVSVPGLEDPEGLKQLIGKTARLEFKLVDLTADPRAQRPPAGSQFLPYPDDPAGVGRIAVKRRAMVSGDQLVDAQQTFDQTTGEPAVSIRFDSEGSLRFGRVTRENVQKPFAIILDDVVLSAPNINSRSWAARRGSRALHHRDRQRSRRAAALGQASGRAASDRGTHVGPELGSDSIRLGAIASIVAVTAVIVFMLVTYGRFGFYTVVGLVLNAVFILGIMALFNASLTLPGIAGFRSDDRRGGGRERADQRTHP
jgi:preprotein translocase subunit SecD